MSLYRKTIIAHLKVDDEDAAHIEQIMRDDIFHSTLDWVPVQQFKRAARTAKRLLSEYRQDPIMKEDYARKEAKP